MTFPNNNMPDHIFNLTFSIGEKQTKNMKNHILNEKKYES
jgi:hypothetical protein